MKRNAMSADFSAVSDVPSEDVDETLFVVRWESERGG